MKTFFQYTAREAARVVVLGLLGILALSGGPTAAAGKTGRQASGPAAAPGVHEARMVIPDAAGAPVQPESARPKAGTVPKADPRSVPGEKLWSALLDDDFESGFPGTTWTVTSSGTEAAWDDWACWSASTSHSVGCAAGGTAAIACGEDYPTGMQTWMTAGPFDLSAGNILDAVLECYLNLECESNDGDSFYDLFFLGVSIDGESFNGYQYAGTVAQTLSLDLTNVPVDGDVRGQSEVWVACVFASDSSVNAANGAQVDDVLLAVDLDVNEPPQVTLTHPVGGEILTIGYSESVSFAVDDPDEGPGDLEIALDYSTDGGSSWTEIAGGLPYQGFYDWTVPDQATTQGRLRVRASDGEDEASDHSAADFAIVANEVPVVSLQAPDGGEVLTANATTTISYTADDGDEGPQSLQIALDYSLDGGTSWVPIESGLPNTGSQPWTTPEATTTQALVRVSAWDGSATASDVSDGTFAIAQTVSSLALGDGSGASGTSVTVDLALAGEVAAGGLQADLVCDGAKAFLSGITAIGRASGAAVEAEQTGENQARILLYFDNGTEIAAGTGTIAQLEFTLQGPGGNSTPVALENVILSDAEGNELVVESEGGTLTIGTPEDAPVLQVSALKNPARPRSLQILVQVENGSGDAPTVTAGGTGLSLTSLGQAVYLATYAASSSAASVTIVASDSNIQGIGSTQITVEFP